MTVDINFQADSWAYPLPQECTNTTIISHNLTNGNIILTAPPAIINNVLMINISTGGGDVEIVTNNGTIFIINIG
jgi:hypothetical protein